MRRPFAASLAALALLALSACRGTPSPADIATPGADTLLALTFPGWRDNGQPQVRDVVLEAPAHRPAPIAEIKPVPAQLKPLSVVRIDAEHAVVLTETVPLDDFNTPRDCHACAAHLGAYHFTLKDGAWTPSGAQHAALTTGVNGHLGTVSTVALAAQEQAVVIDWGSCWQGSCGSWLVLARLTPDRVLPVAGNIPLSADNTGNGRCTAEGDEEDDDAPGGRWPACHAIEGAWRIAEGRIQVDFTGWRRPAGTDDTPPPRLPVKASVVYVIQNGRLERIEGDNPVPEL